MRSEKNSWKGVLPLVTLSFVVLSIMACCLIGVGQASHSGVTESDDNQIGAIYATLVPGDSEDRFDLSCEFPAPFKRADGAWHLQGADPDPEQGIEGDDYLIIDGKKCWKVGMCDVLVKGTSGEADLYAGVRITMTDGGEGRAPSGIEVYSRLANQEIETDPALVSGEPAIIGGFTISPEEGESEVEMTLTLEFYCYCFDSFTTTQLRSISVSSDLFAVAEL